MAVLASLGSWLPFAVITLLIVFFSTTFTLRYQQKRKRDYVVTLVCSGSLIIALLTASLLPTDVILVSFMKNPNGTYKDWAQNETERDDIQRDAEIGYYVLYGLVIVMTFFVNPFLFFFYEEKEDEERKTSKKLCSALKWTIGFVLFLFILILLGIFIPQISKLPVDNSTSDWDDMKYLFDHFDASRLEDSISFTIFTISLLGFVLLTIYTGYGSIALPLMLIRGKRSARLQQESIEEKRAVLQSKIRVIRARYPRLVKIPPREKDRLEELERQELTLTHNEEAIKSVRGSFCFKFRAIYRPLQIFFGVLLILFALLIFISLLLSNIDKCINFNSFRQIFAQGNKTLPNPVDVILTWTGQFYPMSYIVLSLLLVYIIFTSIFGLKQLGIWFLWVRMYQFSHGRTKPQAILMLSSLMMFIVIAINIFVYLLIPQYSIYGDQHYLSTDKPPVIKPCIQYVTAENCETTVMGRIILRFFYKVWFFGAAYFLLSWLYLIMFVATCVVKLVRNRDSNIDEFSVERLLDDDEDASLIQ